MTKMSTFEPLSIPALHFLKIPILMPTLLLPLPKLSPSPDHLFLSFAREFGELLGTEVERKILAVALEFECSVEKII
ncbi:uncharacterized protein LOC100243015 isoform X2 [Vitis vinifera]|uniref:uncharacterized protein LOC100243015 isoform X2 n=1 Tax=Vitis vinifera TaxID=29760 RepID=UPI002882F9BF|nr:uncharacterized protein LOC100243015 isoform X2 [Vitis vinifera]